MHHYLETISNLILQKLNKIHEVTSVEQTQWISFAEIQKCKRVIIYSFKADLKQVFYVEF